MSHIAASAGASARSTRTLRAVSIGARLLGVVAVLALVAYGLAAFVVYDRVSSTAASPKFQAVAPDNLEFDVGGASYDFSRYEIAGYSEVRFASRDPDVEVAGWFASAGRDAPAVIMTHGLRTSRHDPATLVPAGMLHAAGFSVLVIDLRDHGDSTWEDGRYAGGAEEFAEVLGARDWLVARGVPQHRIGLFGTSMGAAAVLIAAAEEPGFGAVWEDSSYGHTQTRIVEELEARGYPGILAAAAPAVAWLTSGDDLASWNPLRAVAALVGTPLFITHGGDDPTTFVHHALDLQRAAAGAGVDVELWIAPGMGHTQTYRLMPEEYEARLTQFFGQHLGH